MNAEIIHYARRRQDLFLSRRKYDAPPLPPPSPSPPDPTHSSVSREAPRSRVCTSRYGNRTMAGTEEAEEIEGGEGLEICRWAPAAAALLFHTREYRRAATKISDEGEKGRGGGGMAKEAAPRHGCLRDEAKHKSRQRWGGGGPNMRIPYTKDSATSNEPRKWRDPHAQCPDDGKTEEEEEGTLSAELPPAARNGRGERKRRRAGGPLA